MALEGDRLLIRRWVSRATLRIPAADADSRAGSRDGETFGMLPGMQSRMRIEGSSSTVDRGVASRRIR